MWSGQNIRTSITQTKQHCWAATITVSVRYVDGSGKVFGCWFFGEWSEVWVDWDIPDWIYPIGLRLQTFSNNTFTHTQTQTTHMHTQRFALSSCAHNFTSSQKYVEKVKFHSTFEFQFSFQFKFLTLTRKRVVSHLLFWHSFCYFSSCNFFLQ